MKQITFFVCIFSFHFAIARDLLLHDKLTSEIEKLIQSPEDASRVVDLLVKGDSAEIKFFMESNNGIYKYTVGRISSVRILVSKITALASLSSVVKLNYHDFEKDFLCNDTARRKNNVDLVQSGHSPLGQAYTGKNVIIGLYEPLDRHHPDFQDSLGRTRILYCWATRDSSGTPPSGFGYGTEYSSADIDNGLADSTLSGTDHGTACAGVACGNARANGLSMGMAPDANIIVATSLVDGLKYIFDKASSLGKPCVISLSVGAWNSPFSYFEQGLYIEIMDSLVVAQPGRSIVVANGNTGNEYMHYRYTSTSDTLEAFSSGMILSGDTALLKGILFSYSAYKDSMTNPTPSFVTRFMSFDSLVNEIDFMLCGDSSLPSSTWNHKVIAGRLVDQNFGVMYIFKQHLYGPIYPDHSMPNCDSLGTYFWKLKVTGQGEGDFMRVRTTDIVPSIQQYPDQQHYMFPDNMCNLNGYAVSEKVISVGYAQNRASHIDYNGNLVTDTNALPDELTISSGHGPTLKGVLKPDIVATANYVMTAMPVSRQADAIANFPYSIDQGAFHTKDGGSSMAAPLVAGGIALFFEKYPNATWLDVKNAIINCPKQDSFTGTNLPNNFWGYGKFNAFGLLTNCAPDYVSELYEFFSEVYPNPSSDKVHFRLMRKENKIDLFVFSSDGKLVRKINSMTPTNELIVDGLNPGIYFYRINKEESVASGKFVLIN